MKHSWMTELFSYAPEALTRQAVTCFGGVQVCGWQPAMFAIDEVAKRVCPWKSAGAFIALGASWPLNLAISRSHRSVRFPLTTRLRTPWRVEPLP